MVFSGVVWSTSRLHANTVKSGYCLSIVTIALRHTLAGHFFTFADARYTSARLVEAHSCLTTPTVPPNSMTTCDQGLGLFEFINLFGAPRFTEHTLSRGDEQGTLRLLNDVGEMTSV